MKKVFAILTALCLLCASCAALAETPAFENMPLVVTVEDGTELTDADFEGDWTVDKIFVSTTYLAPEEAEAKGLMIRPIRIADGQVSNVITDEAGEEHEAATKYTIEANQLIGTDGEGTEFVIEKLEDGNIVMSIFVPGEGEGMICISYFMVHP